MASPAEPAPPPVPDWEAFLACLRREGTPRRVHGIELFLDGEIQNAIVERFGLCDTIGPDDPHAGYKRQVELQRFLGYDYVRQGVDALPMPLNRTVVDDTATALKRGGGRTFMDESRGPITSWAEFDAYPWPDPEAAGTTALEWYERNLPDDMCVVGSGGFAHFAEYLTWLMGYETFCYMLYDDRSLVEAIAARLLAIYEVIARKILEFDRVKVMWGSDDMGFKTGPMMGVDDLRQFVFPGHRRMGELSHAAGRPYLLHSCGNLACVMDELIDDVGIDARHSFEDTIEDVRDAKRQQGGRVALLGGIDVDFLCRASESEIRQRVRDTLDVCMPRGGYCLGTGNSVANYIPLDHYLAMLDEGRRYA